MSNTPADYPDEIHEPTDISGYSNTPLGKTPTKHSDVHEKIEQELKAIQEKLGVGAAEAAAAAVGKVLTKKEDGSTGWEELPGGVPDEPYEFLDLSGKVFGSIPAGGEGGEYIPESVCEMYHTRVGRTVTCVFLIAIPSSANWPAANQFFPITLFGIKGSDLPYFPRIYPTNPNLGIPISAPGAFSLVNVNSDDNTYTEGRAIGTVITDFGGGLDVPSMVFFKATDSNQTNLDNLIYEGSPLNFIGNNVVSYARLVYEAAYAMGEEPE